MHSKPFDLNLNTRVFFSFFPVHKQKLVLFFTFKVLGVLNSIYYHIG